MKKMENLTTKIKLFLDNSNIHVLVYLPPMISFSIYIILLILIDYFSKDSVSDAYLGIGLGIVSFVSCISGIAQIYKKEMPLFMGNIYKGNLAVLSGIIIVVSFGITGITAMIIGFSDLIREGLEKISL